MSYIPYYGTPSNTFAGISRPSTAPVASGALAIYTSDTNLADFAASRVPFWDGATAYSTVGQQVVYDNQLWAVVAASTGVTPGTDSSKWALLGTGGGGGGSVGLLGYYRTDTTLTTTPTAGKFTWNDATQISSTHLYVNKDDDQGTDLKVFWELAATGDTILIQDQSDSANYQLWTLTATPTYSSGVFDFTVSLSTSGGTGTTNMPNNHQVFLYEKRAAVPAIPTGQIAFGGTTALTSSADFTFDNATSRFIQTATVTTSTAAAHRLAVTFDGVGEDMAGYVFNGTMDNFGVNTVFAKWQTNDGIIRAQIKYDGSASFGVNSKLAWGDGEGGILALGTPIYEPTLSPTPGNMAMWFKASTGRIRTISGTGNTVSDVAYTSDLASYIPTSQKGAANGVAPLDSGAKISTTYLPDAVLGAVKYQGTWDASTNTPTLANPPTSADAGHYYIVSTGGTFAGITFSVGDWIIDNGGTWAKVDNTDTVVSVFGRIGTILANAGDYAASQVTNDSGVSGTYVDDALDNLSTAIGLKAPIASPTFTGTVTIPAGASISGYATTASLVKGATSNQIQKGNAAGSYAAITSTYSVATSDANAYLQIGSGTFTVTIPCDTLGAALEANSCMMIPWRKIGTGTTTFAVSGSGASLTLLGGGTLGTATTGMGRHLHRVHHLGHHHRNALMYIPIYSMMSSQIRTYRWDLAVTTGIQDGQGTWNTTNTYFSNDNGATRIAWVPGSIAQFGGGSSGTAGGNIVTGTQTCTGLIFNTPFAGAYTFGGGTIAFIGASFIECNSATGMTGSGVLSGDTITVRGTATFTIAGASTPNTMTTLNVTSGATVTFTLGFTTKLPTSSLIVGGTVNFSQSTSAATISCVISGSGTIASSNTTTNPLIVLGDNTFTGTWTHSGTGTLQIGNSTSTPSNIGACSVVLSGGTMLFARATSWTLSASVSGVGTATVSLGDITLTGAWTAGAISLTSGTTIRIGAGGTVGSCSANLSNAGAKVFNRSNDYTYPGVISGAGAVTHSGTGTLTFSANQTYTGTTTISAGPLRLGGTLAATAITVANTTGASIGASTAATRTIAGSVTFAGSNAALDVQTNGTTVASRLTVTGGVVRGGAKVNVLGALNAGSYIIISGASGSSSGAEFTIGTNLSGRTCTFSTVSGVTTMTAT